MNHILQHDFITLILFDGQNPRFYIIYLDYEEENNFKMIV